MLATTRAIEDPFEQSFFLLVQLPYLQAFEDVNKRVSRLTANIPFFNANLSPLSFIDVPKDDYLLALLAIYEVNRIEPLRDIFVWAYKRSAQQYEAVRNAVGEPDEFILKNRDRLKEIVNLAVTSLMKEQEVTDWVTKNIDSQDTAHFLEVVLEELEELHDGNIGRYQLRLSEFIRWKDSLN